MSTTNKQPTRTELQQTLESVKSQREEFSKRRDELISQADGLTQSIDTRTRTIGERLLNRLDSSGETDALARDKAKREVLSEGIRQADAKLRLLDQEIQDRHLGLAAYDFNAVLDRAISLTLVYKSRLHDAGKVEDEIAQLYKNLELMNGRELERDHAHAARTLFGALSLGLEKKLAHIEGEYSAIIQAAEQKSVKSG